MKRKICNQTEIETLDDDHCDFTDESSCSFLEWCCGAASCTLNKEKRVWLKLDWQTDTYYRTEKCKNDESFIKAIEQVYQELSAMSPEEFKKELEKHKD